VDGVFTWNISSQYCMCHFQPKNKLIKIITMIE
jgi:hypothetical protein